MELAKSGKDSTRITTDEAAILAISRISAVPTILKVVSEVTGLRLALIARVTDSSWTACAVLDRMEFGLSVGDHLDIATTLCSEVRDSHKPVIIEDVKTDPNYCNHRTPKMYGFESYIAVPIFLSGGDYFGNICALDPRPAMLRDEKTVGMMTLFSELIALQLTAEEEASRDRSALTDERRNAELREQFIAVLGHDLRNPLSAISAASSFLLELPNDQTHRSMLERIRSSTGRMSRLIDDIMDFARGRLGGGMSLDREQIDLSQLVREVVDEIAGANTDRVFRVDAIDSVNAWLDRARIAQLLSNLVANAVEHGTPGTPVVVRVEASANEIVLDVISHGGAISEDTMHQLFQPYFRAASNRPRAGLGLGLHIASEIAHAHNGFIRATSQPEGTTTFTVRLPRIEPIGL